MIEEDIRAKVVAAALTVTENTAIAPSQYELLLLNKYVRGVLSIEEVIALLAEYELQKGQSVAFGSNNTQALDAPPEIGLDLL